MSKFGVIVTTRAFFPGFLALDAREIVLRRLKSMGHQAVIIDEDATKYGAVESYDDAAKCAELFRNHRDEIDGIIVILPNFGEEGPVSAAIDMAKLDVPVLIVASDDEKDKMDLAHRRDAFCGKLSLTANLYQYGIKFTNTHTHTLPLDSEDFDYEVDYFSRVCNVFKGLRGARIGAVGARPAAFQTVRYSEKLLQRSGISVSVIDMSDMISKASSLKDDDPDVIEAIERISSYGTLNEEATSEKVLLNAKLLTALTAWLKENRCDAFAFQCWDSLQHNFGCASCLSMSMLGELGIPGACEMDVSGAVSMLAMSLATGSPAGYLDWNNGFSDDRNKCVCLHCSSFPNSFLGEKPEIGSLDVLGTTIDRELCFGANKGRVQPGPFTFLKVSTDDIQGKIRYYVGEGEFTDDNDVYTPGAFATCYVPNLQQLLNYLVKNGFEHHVCMGRTNVAEVIEEALGNYLGWDGYVHN
ncbi:MAG: L-fucose/L-arabinose isomerase family protein [Eubacteriales bacterium]|jgi:L-fucose isomerase-like protein